MATVNGAPSPPPQPAVGDGFNSETSDNKRKREDDVPVEVASKSSALERAQIQKDILKLLERSDIEPSLLRHTIEHKTASDERSPKKARLSGSSTNTSTIFSKLSNGAYATLQDLANDAEHVSESQLSAIRTKAKEREGQNGRLLVEDLKQMQRAQAFEQLVKEVVEQETKYEAAHADRDARPKKDAAAVVNGDTTEPDAERASRGTTVLTLFGNAPTPKQLFSSTQIVRAGSFDSAIKAELPVEEMSLPTGLSVTRIMPVPADETQKGPTFEEAFPPPYNLPLLNPPRSHRRSTTRDETIKWEFKDPLASRSKKGGYTTQSLTVGEWLGYGGVEGKDEPASPREKRKQRERVLSSGESSQPPPSRTSLQVTLAKEEEALFRKVYSSFAPYHDNGKAIVPEEVKNMVWWYKLGHQRYEETFAIDPALTGERVSSTLEITSPTQEVEEDFSSLVDEFDEAHEEKPQTEPSYDKANVDRVLQEISELLETLASYQRIRNASLQSSSSVSRTPISPAPTLASRSGRPDSPGTDEINTYTSLRHELAYLILKLPPYAVAKLNGDQLEDLGVSKLIPIQGKNVKGTMEEDIVARQARQTAAATAASINTLSRTGSGGQHYSVTNQRTPAIGQAANTRYGQSGHYGVGRGPISQAPFNRPMSGQSTYGTPSATAPRPGYGQPNQYSRAPQPGYGQTNGQQYYQRQVPQGTPGYGSYGQQYNSSTPQALQRGNYSSSQYLAQYQQRSHAAAQNAVAYQTSNQGQSQSPLNRTASPLKPAPYQPPLQPSPAPRGQAFQPPPPSTSDRATPSYPSQPQTPVNGVPAQQRPVAPRESSGTPQPVQAQPAQTNGLAGLG